MTPSITHAAFLKWPEIRQLTDILNAQKIDARFVGGAVRDALLGVEVTDVDMCTPVPPETLMQQLKQAGLYVIPTGIDHGTITVHISGRNIEITTLRRDVACDGRHAEVTYSTDYAEDARRRDFTINALSADMAGNVYDYHDGVKDLHAKTLRFIGDAKARITEDALRILRLFRFESQLGFMVDEAASSAAAELKQKLTQISAERIKSELFKLLAGQQATQALHHLSEAGIWQLLLEDMAKSNLNALLEAEEKMGVSTPLLRLTYLVAEKNHADAANTAKKMQDKLKLSNEETKNIKTWVENLPLLSPHLSPAGQKKMQRRLGTEHFLSLLLLAAARDQEPAPYASMQAQARSWNIPTFPINGEDLKTLGISEGAALGKLLQALENRWEESGYTLGKKELLESARLS